MVSSSWWESLSVGRCSYSTSIVQVSSIVDTTQLQMREVDSTGTLKAGEKALADLRKRKLIAQRYVA